MYFKKINYENSKTNNYFNPHIYGCYYNYTTGEELLFNKKELRAMLRLNYLSDPADNYENIFYTIADVASSHRELNFKKIISGLWKEVEKAYNKNKEEYKKEIAREERGFFIDNDGFYHHSLKEFCWHMAINDGLIAYEVKMGLRAYDERGLSYRLL